MFKADSGMPEYFTSLLIPANTRKDKPATKTVEIEGEVLSEVAYLIPAGVHALARIAVFYGIKQIYPDPDYDWVTGDDLYRLVRLRWTMPESPCTLTIKGYNEDEAFPHTFYVWLFTEKRVAARPWEIIADFVAILKKLMGLR